MSFTVNSLNCIGSVKNTGVPLCPIDPEFIIGAVLAPRGTILDGTTQSLSAALTSLIYNPSKTARGYVLYDFEKITDNGDKLTLQSMPNGAKHPVREGFNDDTFQYFDGGLSKHQAARTFNGNNWDFFYIDTNPRNGKCTLYGIGGGTANKLQAFPCNPGGFFWAHPWGRNTGTERSAYMLQFSFAQKYSNDLLAAVACPFDFPTAFPGLNDVTPTASTIVNTTPGSYNVSLVSPNGIDIGALNATALSGAGKTNWKSFNTATGAAITITTVTWVPSPDGLIPGYFTIADTTTAPPYPAAGTVSFDLVTCDVLVTAGVDYESTGPVAITKN